MVISVNGKRYEVEMYAGKAAGELVKILPQTISMSKWGDEYYGSLGKKIDYAGDATRDVFEIGEVALWPAGNAFCIFFGPTPASHGSEPRMASPGVALGKIKANASDFKKFGGSLRNVELLEK